MKNNPIVRYFSKKSKAIISVLLAVVFIPFFFLGTTLVEIVRYRSTARAVDQALAVSELSVLADYDPYLLDRFGLLAVDQNTVSGDTLGTSVQAYLNKQLTTDMKGASFSEVTADGLYGLNDPKILQQQIQSYAAVLGPYDMVVNGLEIDELIKQIEDLFMKANSLDKMLKMLQSGSGVLSSEVDLFEKLDTLNDELQKTKEANDDYKKKFTAWQDSISTLIDHLNSEPDEDDYKKKNPDGTESFDESAYNAAMSEWNSKKDDLIGKAQAAKDDYSKAIGAAADAVGELGTAVEEVVSACSDFNDKIEAFNYDSWDAVVSVENNSIDESVKELKTEKTGASEERQKEIDNQIAVLNTQKDANSNSATIASTIGKSTKEDYQVVSDVMTQLNSATLELLKTKLNEERDRVENYSVSSVSAGSSAPSEDTYHTATDMSTYAPELLKAIKDKAGEAIESNLLDQLRGLVKAIKDLYKMDGLYAKGLDYTIESDVYNTLPSVTGYTYTEPDFMESDREMSEKYKTTIGLDIEGNAGIGDDVTAIEDDFQAVADSLKGFIDSLDELDDPLRGGPVKQLVQLLKRLINIVNSAVTLITCTVKLIFDICSNPAAFAVSIERKAVLMDYLVTTMPNRTNYVTGKTLSGYKYKDIGLPTADLMGELLPLKSVLVGQTGDCFGGCELEYIMAGKQNELLNQTIVFGWLYVLRLICDIAPVLTNSEVQNISNALAAVPYAGPFLKIIYIVGTIFAEPYVDCIILVNGGSVKLVKVNSTTMKPLVYLTPTGITEFATAMTKLKLAGATSQTDDTAKQIREGLNKDISNLQKQWSETTGESYTEVKAFPDTNDPPKPELSGFEKFATGAVDKLNDRNYTDHCYILLLLLGSSDKCLRRTADIIQMEEIHRGNEDFRLENSYTCIRAKASGSMVQVFPIPSLSSTSVLSFDRVVYRGY